MAQTTSWYNYTIRELTGHHVSALVGTQKAVCVCESKGEEGGGKVKQSVCLDMATSITIPEIAGWEERWPVRYGHKDIKKKRNIKMLFRGIVKQVNMQYMFEHIRLFSLSHPE